MSDAQTPMMRQYRRIKSELAEDMILFFRLGDFYEMFFDDAVRAAPILDITLTRRNGYPMCGVPYHAADLYLARLIKSGCKVALCDQVEDPAVAKGIVRREVTRIVTPGTVTEDAVLEAARHNFLAGLAVAGDRVGLALLDISTGAFWGEELAPAALADALRRYAPSECCVAEAAAAAEPLASALRLAHGVEVTPCEDWTFAYDAAHDLLTRHFGVKSLQGFGCEGARPVVMAAGAVLAYVRDTLRRQVNHIRAFRLRNPADFMVLDESTCVNLDLVPARGGAPGASLLHVLDATRGAMGARTLRDWLLRPLAELGAIRARHDAVAVLCRERALLGELRDLAGQVRDLERLVTRIGAGTGNAREVQAVGASAGHFPALREWLTRAPDPLLQAAGARIEPCPDLVELIGRAIVDEPPLALKDGGVIRPGYHAELDELRAMASSGRDWLARYQAEQQEQTGIKTLKVRHNKVFGYYIEVSKGQIGNVPAAYIRKQTIVNGERYITPELKEYENRIVGAQERAVALEIALFGDVRDAVVAQTARLQQGAAALGEVDVLCALADRALALGWVRPEMTAGDVLEIRGGRHPIVEQMPDAGRFVPNDTRLDGGANQLMIITGPNMAGKSTYIRQVALIAILAHMGSFVPADAAVVGLIDRVFTRVGASDDLARGRSTFMVEMEETANILNNATPRSLIVLDEIGRGTSTFDGISIAWAVAEYLHNHGAVKARTLFATHYHELTDLALTMKGVCNYNVLVKEQKDGIVFLRRIVPGGADKSYGIHVARLAGMPDAVVSRAREILANLEEGELGEGGQPKIAKRRRPRGGEPSAQLDLFGG